MMPANFSIILNVILLIGVVIAIRALMKGKREQVRLSQPKWAHKPSFPAAVETDEILAVRKVSPPENKFIFSDLIIDESEKPEAFVTEIEPEDTVAVEPINESPADLQIMMFLLAKEGKKIAGYELLQTLLTAGLRFGEGALFHRHQYSNGKGPVLFSLAAATATGTFDLQNIGAFSAHGLCLFLQASHNAMIDAERFETLLETAKQLSEDLDTHWLDECRKPFTKESELRMRQALNIAKFAVAEVV